MDYKQIALIKEQKLEKENNRLKVLLFNAIVYLEQDFDDKEQLLEELGMTKKEYKEIMGE